MPELQGYSDLDTNSWLLRVPAQLPGGIPLFASAAQQFLSDFLPGDCFDFTGLDLLPSPFGFSSPGTFNIWVTWSFKAFYQQPRELCTFAVRKFKCIEKQLP